MNVDGLRGHGRLMGQLFEECNAMARHALAVGLPISANAIVTIQRISPDDEAQNAVDAAPTQSDMTEANLRALLATHNELSALVAPATPATLSLLAREAVLKSPLRFLGAVSLVRRLMLVAIGSLGALILLSLSPDVGGSISSYSLASSGIQLLLNELFLISCASLGACFSNLYMAHQFVKVGTFDPARESDYWVRLVLGVLAGTMLALLIQMDAASGSAQTAIGPPLLALLGGFSATVVYEILMRIAGSIESLFKADTRSQLMAAEQGWKQRQEAQLAQQRITLAKRIGATMHAASDGDAAVLQKALEQLQGELLSSGADLQEFKSARS